VIKHEKHTICELSTDLHPIKYYAKDGLSFHPLPGSGKGSDADPVSGNCDGARAKKGYRGL
jgi:hypothetical protein